MATDAAPNVLRLPGEASEAQERSASTARERCAGPGESGRWGGGALRNVGTWIPPRAASEEIQTHSVCRLRVSVPGQLPAAPEAEPVNLDPEFESRPRKRP